MISCRILGTLALLSISSAYAMKNYKNLVVVNRTEYLITASIMLKNISQKTVRVFGQFDIEPNTSLKQQINSQLTIASNKEDTISLPFIEFSRQDNKRITSHPIRYNETYTCFFNVKKKSLYVKRFPQND